MMLRRGGTPVDVKLVGAMGGGASVLEETGVPVLPPPVEKTGANLKNESSECNTTEIDRITK